MFPLTDGLCKMMNFKNVFRWHYPFLFFVILLASHLAAANTLLVLGDSLSAGYRMSASAAWPSLLNGSWQQQPKVVNASISGDTAAQGLARLPALLKQHQPQWVLIELGGNAEPLLMQVRLPANYGRRYTEAFSGIYPRLAQQYNIPLVPFFMEQVYLKPEWMQQDGIHPNPDAQPFIAELMAKELAPLVKHE